MLLVAIAATSLVATPLVDRCRSALLQLAVVPAAESSVRLRAAERYFAEDGRFGGLTPAVLVQADAAPRIALQVEVPDARCDSVSLSGGREPPAAERELSFSPSASAAHVRTAALHPPSVAVPASRAMASNVLETATAGLVYASLLDGTVNPRAREWRMPLVRMLVGGTPGTDFDLVYGLLLRGFAGNDEWTKVRALAKWADANLPPREAADVFRAETRYWLNAGDVRMTVDAAGRMERARPDYAVRARRLSALAYAMAGELEKSKAEIAQSRIECSPTGVERQELAYLEAWIALQDGDVEAARRNLTAIIAEDPRGATARKARTILESISTEACE